MWSSDNIFYNTMTIIISVGGILSPNPEENPFYWNVNHVFVPYCTSDSWSGSRMTKEGMFTFMGSLVVQQVSVSS